MTKLKSEPLVSVTPDADEKEVFALFDKYNLRGLCVVDADRHPMGAITVDDVVTRLCAHILMELRKFRRNCGRWRET